MEQDDEVRRLQQRADRQARRLRETLDELEQVRADAQTPEERRRRFRVIPGAAAALTAGAVWLWAQVRRPEVDLAVASAAALGLLVAGPERDGDTPEARPPAPSPAPSPPQGPVRVPPPAPEPTPPAAPGNGGELAVTPAPSPTPSPTPGSRRETPAPPPSGPPVTVPPGVPTPELPEPAPGKPDDCLIDRDLADLVDVKVCPTPTPPRS